MTMRRTADTLCVRHARQPIPDGDPETVMQAVLALGREIIVCPDCERLRSERERLWVIVHGAGTPQRRRRR